MSKQKNMSNKVSTESFSQIHKSFATTSATSVSSGSNSSTMTETRLKAMLKDPTKNASGIANMSRSTKFVNGMYKRLIKYMSSLLTYDHVLYPVMQNPSEFASGDNKDMQESFAQTAIFLDRLNPKFNLPIFTEKVFTNGSVYLYKLEDKKSVAYMEFPCQLCRIAHIDENVYRFQIDVSKISDSEILLYPKEIQSAHTSYKSGNDGKFIDRVYYPVSDKGVAFTVDIDALIQGGMSLPPFSHSLLDTIRIERAKESMENSDKLDNSKIIHSKIETDDRGRPTVELKVAREYHNALKKALPEGAVAVTNPFETTALNLNGTGKNSKFELLDKTVDQLYKGAGVSPQLFADDNSSSQALERSIQVDVQWLYSFLLPMYANYYNYELSKAVKSKSFTWKVKFLEVSYFNREDSIKVAKEQLSFGGSRLEYLAYMGMTPIQAVNMFVFEQNVLNIDDLMVVKETSYTQSGTSDEAGRPSAEKPTDDTIRIKDSE